DLGRPDEPEPVARMGARRMGLARDAHARRSRARARARAPSCDRQQRAARGRREDPRGARARPRDRVDAEGRATSSAAPLVSRGHLPAIPRDGLRRGHVDALSARGARAGRHGGARALPLPGTMTDAPTRAAWYPAAVGAYLAVVQWNERTGAGARDLVDLAGSVAAAALVALVATILARRLSPDRDRRALIALVAVCW